MRKILPLAALLLAVAGCTTPRSRGEVTARSDAPNILVILVDDLGAMDLGYAGSDFHETPAVDALAAEGMVFTNAYAAYPRCVPSRYAFMTGRSPARGQVPAGPLGETLPADEVTIAEALRAAGYATFFVGKWHLGHDPGTLPEAQGFDLNIAGGSAGAVSTHFFPYGAERELFLGPGLEEGVEGEYLTDRLTAETITFLEGHTGRQPGQPFFAVLSHYAVHTPIEAPHALVAHFRAKLAAMPAPGRPEIIARDGQTRLVQNDPVYAAMVASIDNSVADLRAALDRLGIAENTVIVFTSDHGGLSNRGAESNRRLPTSNWPLRAGKGHLYEGGVRVPLVIAWPGHLAGGASSNSPVNNTDLFPTFLALAGQPQQPDWHTDGNAIAAISGGPEQPEPIYWYNPRPRPQNTGDRASAAIRWGRWKYVLSFDPVVPSALFDLSSDPGESTNLAARYPQRAAELRANLQAYLRDVGAVAPTLDRRGRHPAPSASSVGE